MRRLQGAGAAGSRRGGLLLVVLSSCATRSSGFLPRVAPGVTGQWGRYPAIGEDRRRWGTTDTRDQGDAHILNRNTAVGGWRERFRKLATMKAGLGPGKGTQVVLLRHGMSTFNKLNMFTGWCDVPLAEEGKIEAFEAGKLLAAAGYRFDVAHSSVLKRACTSLHRLLDGCGQPYVPIKTNWRLNERHYGALQGRNKKALEEAMGPIVVEWRRGYGTTPPPMTDTHPHWPLISLDSRYRGLKIPESESLRDTANRVMEYWDAEIVPDIRAGKRVVVVAHANTLRSLVKRLDNIDENAIRNVNIPTGEPFVYEFDADLRPMGEADEVGFRGRFVGDMMTEKTAAVDAYKRREQACFVKWESNPEEVPEECMCPEYLDLDRLDPNSPLAKRLGEDQASLGLDRYSVGFDLPLPAFANSRKDDASAPARAGNIKEQDVGEPLLETLAGISELPTPDDVLIGEDGEREDGIGGEGVGGNAPFGSGRGTARNSNETLPGHVA